MIEHIALMKIREGHYRDFCLKHLNIPGLPALLQGTEEQRKTLFRNFEYALMELLMQEDAIMKVMDENDNAKKSPCKHFVNCHFFDASGVTCNDSRETAFCGTFRELEKK